MSLGTRLTIKTAVLVLAVVVVAGAALWGLGGLNRDLDAALGEYDRLRKAYMLINHVEQARSAASSSAPTRKMGRFACFLGRIVVGGLTMKLTVGRQLVTKWFVRLIRAVSFQCAL